MDDFFLRALFAGIGVAAFAGPLGCFVVWRKMAYFGAALAHAALLGVALGFLLDVQPFFGVFLVALMLALALTALQSQSRFSSDTLLGILAHLSLALGLVVIAMMDNLRIDLMGYLFGDILAVTKTDLVLIYGGAGVILTILALTWRSLLSSTVHEELSRVEGVNTSQMRLLLMLLLALGVALCLKIVGLLLITSLLIIPPAAARALARTPEKMALMAALIGIASVVFGLAGSYGADWPAGPAIVLAASLVFGFSLFLKTRI